jgi:hypothetical protein
VSHYRDPELSWKYEIAPTELGFMTRDGLGERYEGSMFVGEARVFLEGGYLLRMDLTHNRKHVAVSDPRLADGVADNVNKFDITESESLLFGRNFGIATEVTTGANGNLFVVSLSDGAVYEVFRPGGAAGHDHDHDDHGRGRFDFGGTGTDDGGRGDDGDPRAAVVRVSATVPPLGGDLAEAVRRSQDGQPADPGPVARSVSQSPATDDFLSFDPIPV